MGGNGVVLVKVGCLSGSYACHCHAAGSRLRTEGPPYLHGQFIQQHTFVQEFAVCWIRGMWHSTIQQEGPAKGDKEEHQEGRGGAWKARRHTCSEVERQKRGENAHHCPRPLCGVKEEEDPTGSWWLPGEPYCVDQYNTFMGGVDRSDQLLSYYGFAHRTVKWWKRLFFHLLDVAVCNSYTLYTQSTQNKKLTHKEYRVSLAKAFLQQSEDPHHQLSALLTERHFLGHTQWRTHSNGVCRVQLQKGTSANKNNILL